jgi:hypothetical protein
VEDCRIELKYAVADRCMQVDFKKEYFKLPAEFKLIEDSFRFMDKTPDQINRYLVAQGLEFSGQFEADVETEAETYLNDDL